MVTMSSEKSACRRKPVENIGGGADRTGGRSRLDQRNRKQESLDKSSNSSTQQITASCIKDTPNYIVYKKMEAIVEKMLDEEKGVTVNTVKSFMTTTPSVFTGIDLISWMTENMNIDAQEALHVGHLMASHGYFFPIDDHCLTVKNDSTFYRFQTPYFWPSNCWEPENTDYAIYLCKRTMQNKTRMELADYEAENLALLQKMFSRKWDFIFMQAEAQSKVAKKRDKLERKVLDSQERAFWDVYRPMPGCVNTTELDMKKECRTYKAESTPSKHVQLGLTGGQNAKVPKVAEALIGYFQQYVEYDPFITETEFSNPWISNTIELWEQDKLAKEISVRRVKRWAFSLQELLQDSIGREQFKRFLDKEFSGENLKFWETVQELKTLPQKEVEGKVEEIWHEFLGQDASCPINVDSRSFEITKNNMEKPDRWCFDVAAAHVYHLMKSDSYPRYLRSEMYQDFVNGSKKKTSVKGIRSIVSFSGRRDTTAS